MLRYRPDEAREAGDKSSKKTTARQPWHMTAIPVISKRPACPLAKAREVGCEYQVAFGVTRRSFGVEPTFVRGCVGLPEIAPGLELAPPNGAPSW